MVFFALTNRPAIVVLLMSMVNERQPFVLRCAVLYCFQCFLYKNHKGQGEIVSTLLPSTIDGMQTITCDLEERSRFLTASAVTLCRIISPQLSVRSKRNDFVMISLKLEIYGL